MITPLNEYKNHKNIHFEVIRNFYTYIYNLNIYVNYMNLEKYLLYKIFTNKKVTLLMN